MLLTEKTVKAATAGGKDEEIFWDDDLAGFGLRVQKSGTRSFVIQYRTLGGRRGRIRKFTLGRYGAPWTVDAARREAVRILSEAKLGGDPAASKGRARTELRVDELCDLYFDQGCALKKPKTIAFDKGRVTRHIKPLMGKLRISEVAPSHVEAFLRDVALGRTAVVVKTRKQGKAIVRGGPGAATRAVGLLGSIFTFAMKQGLRADNPVRGVRRFQDKRHHRFLSPAEWAKFGLALKEAEDSGASKAGVALLRLLSLTGMRKSEAENLKWAEVDLENGALHLRDSKTGPRPVVIGAPAQLLLTPMRKAATCEWVFPNAEGAGPYGGVVRLWRTVRKSAGLSDVRLHDLRHSFASAGLGAGAGLPIIGALLGHADAATTARYAHLGSDPVRTAADRISTSISENMGLIPEDDATWRSAHQIKQ